MTETRATYEGASPTMTTEATPLTYEQAVEVCEKHGLWDAHALCSTTIATATALLALEQRAETAERALRAMAKDYSTDDRTDKGDCPAYTRRKCNRTKCGSPTCIDALTAHYVAKEEEG